MVVTLTSSRVSGSSAHRENMCPHLAIHGPNAEPVSALDAARALLAMGITGRLEMWHRRRVLPTSHTTNGPTTLPIQPMELMRENAATKMSAQSAHQNRGGAV